MLCNLRFLPVLLLAALPYLTAAANECPDFPSPRAKKRMVHLENELRFHNALYYQKSRPVISDAQYDQLFAELVQMEQCFPALANADSPTRKISNDSDRKALTLRHERPMLSLSSSTGPEAVEALLSRAKALEQEPLLLVQPKVDGLPVELAYRSGRLFSAATRGNGRQGADVTSRVKEIQGIPHELSGNFPKLVTVRGEIYADRGLMAKAAQGSMRNYATPRHFAAAALKSKHPDPIALAALRLFPFQWVDAEEGSGVTSDLAALGVLSLWGFPVRLDLTDQARNPGEIRTAYQKHLTGRGEQSFAADGIVAKLDDLSLRRRLGEGARAPFWAAAWKFPPETAQTLVREIRWNSGRTGRRTPVAELVPVSLGGVRVSRVSLSNAGTVRRLGIAAGDQVLIGLVADIIPQVLEVKKKAGRTDESDTTPAEAPESGMTGCLSDATGCREQFLARAVHFTSKGGLNVAGLGPGRLRKLVEAGLVRDLPSLFRLKREEVAALTGFNAASARSLTAALRRVGRPEPFRLLTALGIPGVGPATAKRLSKQFQSLDELLQSQCDGSMAVQNIHRFFESQQGRELLRGLREVDLL